MTTQLATMTNLLGALETATVAISADGGSNASFMKFTKSGEWLFGSEETEVEQGSTWAVNPESFIQGYQAWDDDSNLEGEEFAVVTDPPIIKADLKQVDGQWKKLVGFQMICISGEDKGSNVIYKTTSMGGVKAVSKLMQSVVKQIRTKPDSGKFVPVIELEGESYKHKKYGKVYTPLLDVTSWTDSGATPDTAAAKPEVPAVKEVAAEPEPAKPRRRRRSA